MRSNTILGQAAVNLTPTIETYDELQRAFDHFNGALFGGLLPHCLITLQREHRTRGYFSKSRFVRRCGRRVDEIAMHPGYFAVRPIRDTLSTLAHEMVHLWQSGFGRPGRRGYHNREWAERMEAVGLVPSDTGAPGGKRTGERMSHYVAEGGPFDVACTDLMTREFTLSWFDRFPPVPPGAAGLGPAPSGAGDDGPDKGRGEWIDLVGLGIEAPAPGGKPRTGGRVKYRCPGCGVQVWGKPDLALMCGACGGLSLGLVEGEGDGR